MIAAPAAPTSHDPFGAAYEVLRRSVLGDAPFGGHVGLVLLRREGLTGWMAHVAPGTASVEPTVPPERCVAASRVSDAAAVVRVLASLALSGLKEKRV